MTEKPKRDQRAYEACNKYSTGVLAAKMMAAVDRLGDPYANKPCVSGVRGYPPKVMAVVVALCEHGVWATAGRQPRCAQTAICAKNWG